MPPMKRLLVLALWVGGCGTTVDQGIAADARVIARDDASVSPFPDAMARLDASSTPDAATVMSPDAANPDAMSGDGACVSTPETCNKLDDDCNGLVDDIDIAADGINDCRRIAILGTAGVFGSSDFVAWLTGNGVNVVRIHTTLTASITPFLLAQYEVLLLDRLTHAYSAGEAALLTEWVEAGGGLISLTGYTGGPSDLINPGSLLAPLGVEYINPLLNQDVVDFVPHVTTSSLARVTFSGGFRVARTPLVGTATATYIASLATGPVGIAVERGEGRAFVWGDEWVTFDSEWRNGPDIRRFWINVLGWVERVR